MAPAGQKPKRAASPRARSPRTPKLPPKKSPDNRDTRFFVASLSIAPLELAIGQSGANGVTLISIEIAVAAGFVLSAIFWGPLGKLVPALATPNLGGKITGSTWLSLIVFLAAVGWFADYGARIGFKPDFFSASHSADQPKDLLLKAIPTHARLAFGPNGTGPIQDGPLENVWSWTAVANAFNVQINGLGVTNLTWTVTIVFSEPTLAKTVALTDKQGRSVLYVPENIDAKYIVIVIPGDLSLQTIDIRTAP